MEIADYVRKSIDDWERGEAEPSLMMALAAVDGTARLTAGSGRRSVHDRFVGFLNDRLWLIEPMLAIGIDLEKQRFEWIKIPRRESTFAEVVYDLFRCNLMHAEPLPGKTSVVLRSSDDYRYGEMGPGYITLPDTIIFATLACVVFAPVNAAQRIGNPEYHLAHGVAGDRTVFPIDEFWGRESEVAPYFAAALARLPTVRLAH